VGLVGQHVGDDQRAQDPGTVASGMIAR
jgi:hypothetical protein